MSIIPRKNTTFPISIHLPQEFWCSLWQDSLAGVGLALWRWKCFLKNKQGLWMQFLQEKCRLVQFRTTTWECRQLGSNSSLIVITPPKVPCPGWEQQSSLKNSLPCQYVSCLLPVSGGRGNKERQVIMLLIQGRTSSLLLGLNFPWFFQFAGLMG